MTLEFWYTALLVAMLGAAGVFAVYVVYRLLKDYAAAELQARKDPGSAFRWAAPPRSDQAEEPLGSVICLDSGVIHSHDRG